LEAKNEDFLLVSHRSETAKIRNETKCARKKDAKKLLGSERKMRCEIRRGFFQAKTVFSFGLLQNKNNPS
jgi:hypothetical protein